MALSKLHILAILIMNICTLATNGVNGQGEATTAPAGDIQEIVLSNWIKSRDDGQTLLVLLYQPEACDKCQLALSSVLQVVGQPEVPPALEIVKSSSSDLVSYLRVEQFPTIVYLRDKSHVFYDGNFGVEDLLDWIQWASSYVVHKLNDESFEHLTQAATGATTGDWMVAFYKEPCTSVLPVLESFAVRVHGKTNVAVVNTDNSPALLERFSISECSSVILFKQGKMYKYTLPTLDVASFKSFVDGFYKNVQGYVVPVPKSKFDLLTESIADYIRVQLEGENKNIILVGLSVLAISLLVIILFCCRSSVGGPRKLKKE